MDPSPISGETLSETEENQLSAGRDLVREERCSGCSQGLRAAEAAAMRARD